MSSPPRPWRYVAVAIIYALPPLGNGLVNAALAYAARGWSIIPVKDKRPAISSWKQWQTRRPDADQLRHWFVGHAPTGLAVILGPVSGRLTCRDFDVADNYHRWAGAHADIAKTLPTVATARGFHVYLTSSVTAIHTLGDGELRGGGYVVAPPSRHPSGHDYRWMIPLPDGDLPSLDPISVGLCNREDIESRAGGESTVGRENIVDGESTANTRALLASSVPSVFSAPSMLHAIASTLPRRVGERHRKLFDLARQIKAIVPDAMVSALRPVVVQWHERALPIIGTKPFLDTWADFVIAFENVKYPAGQGVVDAAFERAVAAAPPAKAVELYSAETGILLLAALCRELQRMAGDSEFFLDTRTAGRLLRVDHSTTWRWLKVLCADGILQAGEKGSKATGKASRFRYLNQGD